MIYDYRNIGVGQYPNSILTALEDQEYMESIYTKFLNIRALQKEEKPA